jgi:hypothetical protein
MRRFALKMFGRKGGRRARALPCRETQAGRGARQVVTPSRPARGPVTAFPHRAEREREREAKHHGAYGVDISVDTPWWRTSSSSARPGLLPASWEGLGFHLVAGSGPAGRAQGQGNKGQWKSRNGGAGQTGGRETRNHAHGSPRGADATKCRARHLGEGRTTSALERTHITLTS